jgi:predicted kinase
MCGPAGSGKSTVACELEAQGFIRLSIDEEAWSRGYRAHPLPDDIARAVEDTLRVRLLDLVADEADVVLDYSFWSRQMRAEYRRLLAPLGVVPETIYLATPRDVALARVRARTGNGAHEIQLSEKLAASYFDGFEVPTHDEGPLTVIG